MAKDYSSPALRHFADAAHLAASGRFDNAGHLIGFAAECALKKAAQPFFRMEYPQIDGHLPGELKGRIRRELVGRGMGGQLLQLVAHGSNFFEDWHINDRYSADDHVNAERYEKWLAATKRVFAIAKIRIG